MKIKETEEERELRRRASKMFTNPTDALITFRELLKRHEEA